MDFWEVYLACISVAHCINLNSIYLMTFSLYFWDPAGITYYSMIEFRITVYAEGDDKQLTYLDDMLTEINLFNQW